MADLSARFCASSKSFDFLSPPCFTVSPHRSSFRPSQIKNYVVLIDYGGYVYFEVPRSTVHLPCQGQRRLSPSRVGGILTRSHARTFDCACWTRDPARLTGTGLAYHGLRSIAISTYCPLSMQSRSILSPTRLIGAKRRSTIDLCSPIVACACLVIC